MPDGMTVSPTMRSVKKNATKASVAAGVTISVTTKVASLSQLGPVAGAAGAAVCATGIGLVVVGGALQVAGVGRNTAAAVSSYRHMKGLETIQAQAASLQECCGGSANQHQNIRSAVLPYLIKQKAEKTGRRAVGAVPTIGLAETFYAIGRRCYKSCKGTLGKKRTAYACMLADHLITSSKDGRDGCEFVERIIAELYDMPSMVWIRDACTIEVATDLIAEKMKSR